MDLFQYDFNRDVLTNFYIAENLETGGSIQMRTHFEGLIIFSETFILVRGAMLHICTV